MRKILLAFAPYLAINRVGCLKILLLIGISSFSLVLSAQNIEPGDRAKSLSELAGNAKGSHFVKPSTGIVHYSVPLIKIGDESYNYTVTASYASRALNRTDKNGILGVGWNADFTNAIITQTVRGNNDNEKYPHEKIPNPDTMPVSARNKFIYDVNTGMDDGEYDIFTLSIGGNKIDFIREYSTVGDIVTRPIKTLQKSGIKINWMSETGGWRVVDQDGVIFDFMTEETCLSHVRLDPNNIGRATSAFTNAWHLTEVTTTNGTSIKYEYENGKRERKFVPFKEMHCFEDSVMGPDRERKNELMVEVNYWLSQLNYYAGNNDDAIMNLISYTNTYMEVQSRAYQSNLKFLEDSSSSPILEGAFPEDYFSELNRLSQEIAFWNSNAVINQSSISSIKAELADLYAELSNCFKGMDSKLFEGGYIVYQYPKLLRRIKWSDKSLELNYGLYLPTVFGLSYSENHWNVLNGLVYKKAYSKDSVCVTFSYKDAAIEHDLTWMSDLVFKGTAADRDTRYSFSYNYDAPASQMGADYWEHFSRKPATYEDIPDDYIYAGVFRFGSFSLPHQDALNYVQLADRAPDSAVFHGLLKEVVSPNGGATRFVYEANTFFVPINYLSVDPNVPVGGVRIKYIINNDGLTAISDTITYMYHQLDRSTGKIKSTGFYLEKEGFTYAQEDFKKFVWRNRLAYRSYVNRPVGNDGLLYSYVEEVTKNGKTGYKYFNGAQYSAEDARPDKYFPYWLEDLLLARIYYNTSNAIVKIDQNKYNLSLPEGVFTLRDLSFYLDSSSYPHLYRLADTALNSLYQRKSNPNYADTIYFYPATYGTEDSYILYANTVINLRETSSTLFPHPVTYTPAGPTALPATVEYDYLALLSDPFRLEQEHAGSSSSVRTYALSDKITVRSIEENRFDGRLVKRFKFPNDYIYSSSPYWIRRMVDQHQLNSPVEEQVWKVNPAGDSAWLLSATVIVYDTIHGSNNVFPVRSYKTDFITPLGFDTAWVKADFEAERFEYPQSGIQPYLRLLGTSQYVVDEFGSVVSINQSDKVKEQQQSVVYGQSPRRVILTANANPGTIAAFSFNGWYPACATSKVDRYSYNFLYAIWFSGPYFWRLNHYGLMADIAGDLTIAGTATSTLSTNFVYTASKALTEGVRDHISYAALQPLMSRIDSIYTRWVAGDVNVTAAISQLDGAFASLELPLFNELFTYFNSFDYHVSSETNYIDNIIKPLLLVSLKPGFYFEYVHSVPVSTLKNGGDKYKLVFFDTELSEVTYWLVSGDTTVATTTVSLQTSGKFKYAVLDLTHVSAALTLKISLQDPLSTRHIVLVPENALFQASVYDMRENLVASYDHNFNLTEFEYDEFGRPVLQKDKHGHVIEGRRYYRPQ